LIRNEGWEVLVEVPGAADPDSREALGVEFDSAPGVPVSVNEVDPLIGGVPVEGLEGWFYSDWFGCYSTAAAPWLYPGEHKFIYRSPGSSNSSPYFVDDAIGAWWWINETTYPFLYAFAPPADIGGTDIESAWLFFFEATKAPRSFGVVTGDHGGQFLFFDP